MATLAERAAAAEARSKPKAAERQSQTPSAPVKLSKALQAEADYDGPIERVEVDGLAVMKILQHAQSSNISTNAAGCIFGMSLGPRLSVSNVFSLPANHLLPSNITTISNVSSSSSTNADERTKAAKVASEREKEVDSAYRNAKNFIASYVPRAKELNLDSEIVGGYFVAKDGMDLLKEGVLIDILVRYQFGIGSGGGSAQQISGHQKGAVGSTDGQTSKFKTATRLNRRGVAIVYDAASSSTASSLSLKAYSLSPAFLQLHENSASHATHKYDYASLASTGLTPQNLLVSYPVHITSSSALTAFLSANEQAQELAVKDQQQSFSGLSASESLENNLKSLIGAMDSANASVQSLGYQGRAARYGQQNANVDNLNRLDSLRTMAVADGAAKSLAQEAGVDTVKAFAARSSVV